MADPPWHYEDFVSYPGKKGGQRRITKPLPYASMALDDICALPVKEWAYRDCALWLWTTSRYMPDTFTVLDAWGFSYKQTLVWHKIGARPSLGGSIAPNHAEFLILAKRGTPRMGRWESSVLSLSGNSGGAPKHSRKPESILDLIEQSSPGPYLEMFSRRARLGWDTWGDEALHGTDLIPNNL